MTDQPRSGCPINAAVEVLGGEHPALDETVRVRALMSESGSG